MRKLTVLLLPLVLVGSVEPGGTKLDADACARAVAPYLDDLSILIARVDLTRLGAKDLATLTGLLQLPAAEATAQEIGQWHKSFIAAGGKELFVVFSLEDGKA